MSLLIDIHPLSCAEKVNPARTDNGVIYVCG